MEKDFNDWLKINNRPPRYANTIKTITSDLNKLKGFNYDLYSISNPNLIRKIKDEYLEVNAYYEKNKHGNNMYNSALNRYIEFLEELNTSNSLLNDIEQIFDDKLLFENTEKKNLVKCRIGQGLFREQLINYWKGCSVTQCAQLDVLIASHIKPWNVSDNQERLDKFNGLLLIPNLDKLFDKGYISFEDNGKILISENLLHYDIFAINDKMEIKIESQHKKYLQYHRENIFQKFEVMS